MEYTVKLVEILGFAISLVDIHAVMYSKDPSEYYSNKNGHMII